MPGIEPVLDTAVCVIKAVTEVAGILENAEEAKGNPTLSQFLASTRDVAHETAQSLQKALIDLQHLVEHFKLRDTPLSKLGSDLAWYNWLTHLHLCHARAQVNGIHEQLAAVLDQVAALLLCSGKSHVYQQALAASRDEKQKLMSLRAADVPLGELVKIMNEILTQVMYRLDNA